ncbi:hypothetical protein CSA08_01545 [Candidatus Gracilibacteria bacterium]|nr:MAG: hypothetical protein CSA08_01545 [Candidatus Gracilibacteria bacterium]
MKKINKIIATLFICLIGIYSPKIFATNNVTNNGNIIKEHNLSKSYLNKTNLGKKYINKIDNFIEKNKYNTKILNKLSKRIEKLILSNKIKDKTAKNVLIYMRSKINLVLLEVNKKEEKIEDKDKKYIEDKIVNLQLNLFEKGVGVLEKLSKEFENLTNYEEKGDFEINLDINQEQLGVVKSNLKLNNYIAKNSLLDSQLKSLVEASIKSSIKGEDEIDINLSGLIDYISKDGNLYLLLSKLDIKDKKVNDDLKILISKIKEIANKNKYIKYSNDETQEAMIFLKSLNPSMIINNTRNSLSEPLITAYKKEGNRYYLKPTKYACDKIKSIPNMIYGLNGGKCSDGEYNEFLTELDEAGIFYAEILKNNKIKIGFVGNKMLGINTNEGYIIFDNEKVLEVNYKFDAGMFGSMLLDYKHNNHLNFNINSDNTKLNYESTLNKKNECTEMSFSFKEKGYPFISDVKLSLENKKINGKFEFKFLKHNWETGEKMEKNKIIGTIDGKTNYDNKIEKLNINYSGVEDSKEFLNGKINISGSTFNFENKTDSEEFKSNTLLNFKLDKNKLPTNGKLLISIKEKEETYNNFNEILFVNLKVIDGKINGKTKVFEGKEIIFDATHKGELAYKKFRLDNNIKFGKYLSQTLNYSKQPNNNQLEVNYNISIDQTYNKNNLDLFMNMLMGEKEAFKMKIKNTGKREFKKTEIKAPKNTIDYKEVFDTYDY